MAAVHSATIAMKGFTGKLREWLEFLRIVFMVLTGRWKWRFKP